MADIVPPVVDIPLEGDNTPPVVIPPAGDDSNAKMNEMIQEQMKIFQENLMKQFDGDYKEKLNKLNADNSELEEKKQRLLVGETLRSLNMDGGLIDFVYDKDIEITKVKIKQLGDLIESEVDKGIIARFKKNVYIPPSGNNQDDFSGSKDKPRYFV
jgi:hypothetical protein